MLKIYPVVLDLVRRVGPRVPRLRARSHALGDQLERALISIPLNVAEGAYSRGKITPSGTSKRRRHARYHSAAGSAREALACFETAHALGFTQPLEPEVLSLFNRVIGTLVRLTEPRG